MYQAGDYADLKPKKVTLYQQPQYNACEPINIVHEILCDQDLSRAGNLFNLSYDLLLKDFPTTLRILKSMIDSRKYISNLNEQSIVEIVLTKCMAALRLVEANLTVQKWKWGALVLLDKGFITLIMVIWHFFLNC